MGSHPLSERSLSHRSDGRQSSSALSRTNSLGLETTSRLMSSSFSESPFIPPPALFLLGPVPSIIRCWLTTNFSNDSLQYAAICSGSYSSFIGYPMIRKFGLEDLVEHEEGMDRIKLPLYLPEASVHQSSSRTSSPVPQLPVLTIRFVVRDVNPRDGSIQIILGSDVLRSHNADVLFSLDKIVMVDDERNKISVPLVRPENDTAFSSLSTSSETSRRESTTPYYLNGEAQTSHQTNSQATVGVIGQPLAQPAKPSSEPNRPSTRESEDSQRTRREVSEVPLPRDTDSKQNFGRPSPTAADFHPGAAAAKVEGAGVWGPWRRDSRTDSSATAAAKSQGRTMKVLRPSKPAARISTSSLSPQTNSSTESPEMRATSPQQPPQTPTSLRVPSDEAKTNKQWTSNPVGGASAFGWLNPPQQQSRRTVSNFESK